jgi:hypothetical protein
VALQAWFSLGCILQLRRPGFIPLALQELFTVALQAWYILGCILQLCRPGRILLQSKLDWLILVFFLFMQKRPASLDPSLDPRQEGQTYQCSS